MPRKPNKPPTLVSLNVTPNSVAIAAGYTYQFIVAGVWSDGSNTTPLVTWNAIGGSISSTGLYTAGLASGSYYVTATQQGGTLYDTSLINVFILPPPTGSNSGSTI